MRGFSFCTPSSATFVVLPLEVERVLGVGIAARRRLLGVMLVSVLLMVPFIIMGERSGKQRSIFLIAIAVVGVGALALSFATRGPVEFLIALIVFFTAFNLLEHLSRRWSPRSRRRERGAQHLAYSRPIRRSLCGWRRHGWLQTLWGRSDTRLGRRARAGQLGSRGPCARQRH